MTVALITPPALEPLTLQEVKNHLRIDHDHDNDVLTDTLKAARQFVEFSSHQKCISQTWRQYENRVSENFAVSLQVGPIVSITSVTAFNTDGIPTILPPETYGLLQGEDPAVLQLSGAMNLSIANNGLEIDIIAGFGDLGIDVPDTLKRAILLLVAHWYEFRGAVSPQDQPVSLPAGFEALIAQFKRVSI